VRKGVKKFFDFPVFGVQVATLLIESLITLIKEIFNNKKIPGISAIIVKQGKS